MRDIPRCRSAVREAFQKHGRERLVTFDKSSKNGHEDVKGGDLKRHIVTVKAQRGESSTVASSYSPPQPTPSPYYYRVSAPSMVLMGQAIREF